MNSEPLKNELRALVSTFKARHTLRRERNDNRRELRHQIGKYFDGLVDGYAKTTHCRPDVAEVTVRDAVLHVLRQMSRGRS